LSKRAHLDTSACLGQHHPAEEAATGKGREGPSLTTAPSIPGGGCCIYDMLLLHFTWLTKAEQWVLLAPDSAPQGFPKTSLNSWF